VGLKQSWISAKNNGGCIWQRKHYFKLVGM